jgi:hypothetical protein
LFFVWIILIVVTILVLFIVVVFARKKRQGERWHATHNDTFDAPNVPPASFLLGFPDGGDPVQHLYERVEDPTYEVVPAYDDPRMGKRPLNYDDPRTRGAVSPAYDDPRMGKRPLVYDDPRTRGAVSPAYDDPRSGPPPLFYDDPRTRGAAHDDPRETRPLPALPPRVLVLDEKRESVVDDEEFRGFDA